MNPADFIILSYLAPLIIFITLYGTRSPWLNNELGKALMFQKFGFLLVVIVILLSIFLGQEYPFRQEVRTTVYILVGVALWVDVINLLRYQYRARHEINTKSVFSRWVFRDRDRVKR